MMCLVAIPFQLQFFDKASRQLACYLQLAPVQAVPACRLDTLPELEREVCSHDIGTH